MKKIYIIANWKSNKTIDEADAWLKQISSGKINFSEKEIIICPPFTLLSFFKQKLNTNNLGISLGSQNVSPFEKGAYTGEINAQQVNEFVKYVIIGHSERRINFKEDDSMLEAKVKQTNKYGLTPIYCVQNEKTFIPQGVTIVAYEPPTAIGTGHPDTPQNANFVAHQIKNRNPQIDIILYGGSVSSQNISSFITQEHISGVLVGGASLDASKFLELITSSTL